MSRATIRAAVAQYFAPPAVAGINTVFRSKPKIIQQQDFSGGVAGVVSSAVLEVYIERSREHREAFGGPNSGKKRIDHEVGLILHFQSNERRAEDAMDAFDQMHEAILQKLRADHTLANGAVWQAGEGSRGIETLSDIPKTDKDLTIVTAIVRCDVTEWITA